MPFTDAAAPIREILAAIQLGSWEWNVRSDAVSLDPAWHRMLGLPVMPSPQPLAVWSARVHPNDLGTVKNDIRRCLSGETASYENIHRLRHENGSWRYVLDYGVIVERGPAGEPLLLRGVHVDITRLLEREAIGRATQRMAQIGGWELDLATGRTTWSEETYRIHAMPHGTPTCLTAGIGFYVPTDRPLIQEMIELCIAGTPFRATLRIIDAQGVMKWVDVMGEPMRDAEGRAFRLRGTFQDVSEHYVRERLLMRMLDTLPVMVSAKDVQRDFRVVSWNKAAEVITGLTAAEALGKTDHEILPKERADLVRACDLEAIAAKETVAIQWDELTGADGAKVLLRTRKAIVCDERGAPLFVLGVSEDVTAEERYKTELRDAQARLSRLVELVPAGILEADDAGRCTFVNATFARMIGRDAAEAQDLGWVHFVHPADRERVSRAWAHAVAEAQPSELDFRFCRHDGAVLHVHARWSVIRDAAQAVSAFLMVVQDFTETELVQARLDEAQRVAKIGSWAFVRGSQRFHWSPQMFDLFPEDRLGGEPTLERHRATIHPGDRPTWQHHFEDCIATGKPYKLRFRSVFPDRVRWIEVVGGATLDAEGAIAGISGTCQDVTELVLAEERAQSERAKAMQASKLASLGEMSAGIAHEIANPLSVISGTAYAMPDLLDDRVAALARLERISKAADRIGKIIGGLKKFARRADKTEFRPHRLATIVEEASLLFCAKAKRHATLVEIDCASDACVTCDEIEIEQVIVNLVNNAIDAVKDAKDRWVRISVFKDGGEVVMQVRDSGSGVPPDIVEKLFQPFFTTKPVGEGTGLGLSIVKGIVDAHKATIELRRSEPHTCFEIRFPSCEVRLVG